MNLEYVHFTRWTPQRTSPEGVEDSGDEVAVHRANDMLLESTRLGNGRTGEAVQTLCQQHGASLEACGNDILLSASVFSSVYKQIFCDRACLPSQTSLAACISFFRSARTCEPPATKDSPPRGAGTLWPPLPPLLLRSTLPAARRRPSSSRSLP